MTKRSPAVVVLLTLLTFTLYAYYWVYATTDELRRESGRELSPALDVLLTLVTLGFWGIWVAHRNGRLVHDLRVERGEAHDDRSAMLAGIACLSFFTPAAWLIVMAMLQDELNQLAELPDVLGPAIPYRSAAPRARVASAEPAPAHDAPPVFVSSAPAPHVY
ncbi:MAG: DUF4234 domain-containing protein, partial [Sandaracinaceae bacterium]|nr:DUF4234 domain-containing protein [Sandaracinaceae bacterium]